MPDQTENASERPNAGQETARADVIANRQFVERLKSDPEKLRHLIHLYEIDLEEAEQRASSWWEAAKTLNRAWKGANEMRASDAWLNRETRRQCDAVVLALGPIYNDDHHSWSVEKLAEKAAADIASGTKRDTTVDSGTMGAMARILLLASDEKRRADAAEAQLSEMNRIIGEANDRAVRALRERYADRAKLDEIRAVLARWDSTTVAVDLLDEIADLVAPATTEPETPTQHAFQIGDLVRSKHTGARLRVTPPLSDWEPFYYELIERAAPKVDQPVTLLEQIGVDASEDEITDLDDIAAELLAEDETEVDRG